MSLIQTVIELVHERGAATVDDITPELPQFTRKQVLQALQNARMEGWLEVDRGRGLGGGKGSAPSTYRPIEGIRKVRLRNRRAYPKLERIRLPSLPRVASVWELGAALGCTA